MTTKKKQAPYLSQPAAAHDWAAGDAFLDDMEKQPPEQATGRAPATLRDAAVSLGQGIVSGTKMLTDVAGADNAVSRVLDGANEGLQGMYTPARKAEMQRRAQTIADADASGDKGAQVAARMGGFAEAPMQTLLQGAGSIVPTLPAMLVPGGQAVGAANIARAVGMAGVGAAQGVGSVKGSIYDEVKQALLQRGVPEAEAEQQAQAAQSYAGPNAAQIALGGGIWAVAGRVGAEGAIERLVHGAGVKKAIVPRVAGGVAAEGASEAVQGGQQQFATNSALNEAGVETDPWRGVAGAAALEGTVGAIIGGGLNTVPPGDALRAQKLPESGPLTKAANASLEAQAQAADAGVAPAAPISGAAPAAGALDPAAGPAAPDAAGPASPEAEPPIFSAEVLDVKSALAQPGAMDVVRARFGDEGAKQLMDSLAQAQNPRATESVRKKHLQAVQEGLARLNDEPLAPPEPAALGVAQPAALPAPDAPLQIPLDTTPTGVIRVASDGTASAEINAEAIQSRAAAENAASLGTGVPWGDGSMQETAAARPPQLGYDTAPTGTLVADAAGNVTAETAADRINRRQEVHARRAEARRKANLGLTPDVEAAQARMVRPSDIVNPAGAPFKSKFAADRAARTAPDHQVVEVDRGWALRKPEPAEKAATVAGSPDTAGAAPAQGSTPNVEVAQAAAVPQTVDKAAKPQATRAAGAGPAKGPARATERTATAGAAGAQARLVSDWWAGASPADREAAVVRAGYARGGKITGIGKRIASRPWEDVATTVRAKIKAPEATAGEQAQPTQQAQQAANSPPEEVWNGVHGKGMLPHAGRMQLAQKRKQRPDLEWSIAPAPEFGEDRIKLEGRKRSAREQTTAAAPPIEEPAAEADTTQGAPEAAPTEAPVEEATPAEPDAAAAEPATTADDAGADSSRAAPELVAQGGGPAESEPALPVEPAQTEKAAAEAVGAAEARAGKPETIADIGEKIGGARKDMSMGGGTKRRASADARPAWARRFEISQIVAPGGMRGEVKDAGRWVIRDSRSLDWMKQPRQVGRDTYATKEEAEAFVPIAAASLKHRAVPTRDGKYEIWRDISDRKRVKVVDKEFATRDEAVAYIAANAVDIIETNTTFGEADMPLPPNRARSGPVRRDGNVKGEDFKETFGLRAVEFGNWNNQDDRQSLMNDAWDGLLDLADVLGIPPKAIGLNGDLALAFGARGHGLQGARAHYELDRAVINLTKEKGAGSLAHEWFHALDHYFGRQDGKASATWQVGPDGTRTLKVGEPETDMASGGFQRNNSGVRPEVRAAYETLLRTMFKKAEGYVEDMAKVDRFTGEAREELAKRLNRLRAGLSEQLDPKVWKRNNKPATAEQLAEFDAIAAKMVAGEWLSTDWRTIESGSAKAATRQAAARRWTNDALEQLGAIYKATRGRSGFTTDRDGVLDDLRGYMERYGQRLKMLADAQAGTEKTRQVPTEFAMNAKELDQGRGNDYWTTPHEMAARAFQGYVEDKIAEQGGMSRFLNYGPENVGILTPWGFKRPFPAGAERTAINKAFDDFVGELKTQDTDKGVALFSRSNQAGQGRHVQRPTSERTKAVAALAAQITARWKNAPEVVVVESLDDRRVPEAVRAHDQAQRSQGATGEPEGFFYGGKVYLVAGQLKGDADVVRVLFHEALGHYGLRGLYGDKLRSMLDRMAALNVAKVKAKAAEYGLDYNKPADRRVAAEEVLAEMAQRSPELGWVKQAVAAIRNWLRANVPGLRGLKLTDADIVQQFILPARRFVQQGSGAAGGQAAFSRGAAAALDALPPDVTEAQRAALGKISTFKAGETLQERTKQYTDRWRDKLVQGVFDQFAPLKKLDETAYMQARLSKGTDGAVEAIFKYGAPKLTDGALDVDADGKGLQGVLADLGGEHDLFMAWIAGNRAAKLAAEGRENLFSEADIKALKALNAGKMKDGRDRATVYRKARADFLRYQSAVLQVAEESGLIDAEARALWAGQDYVPFYRVLEDGEMASPGQIGGLAGQRAFKKLQGGGEPLGDLLANTLANWSHLMSASMKNQAANKALAAAERMGVATAVPGAEKGSVRIMREGKEAHYLVNDPLVFDALIMLHHKSWNNPAMKGMQKFKHWLTFGVTISPTFRIRNLVRDMVSAVAANDMDYKVWNNLASGWEGTAKDSETYRALMAGGGAIRFGSLNDGDQAEHAKRLIKAGIKDADIIDSAEKVKGLWAKAKSVWGWYQEGGDRAETINRAALYKKLRAEGKSHLEASYAARDVMDFTSAGKWASVRFLTQILPFFNARLQGMYKLGRGAAADPRRFMAVSGAVAMASVMLYLAQADDEDYKALPDWVRETYWPVKVGDVFVYIPKPFEVGALGTIAERATEMMLGGDDYKTADFGRTLAGVLSDQLAMNPVPQMVRPAMEAAFNYDSFRGRPIDSMAQERLPAEDRFTARTSAGAVLAGQATGMSPQRIAHLMRGYFGWLGTQALNLSDVTTRWATDLPDKPAMRWADTFVVGDFVKEEDAQASKYLTRFFEQQRKIDQLYAALQEARKTGDEGRAAELADNEDLAQRQIYKRAGKQIDRLSRAIKETTNSKTMTPEEKRARLDVLEAKRAELARAADEKARGG